MKKFNFLILVGLLIIPLYGQGFYPDSAHLIGYTHTNISESCGSRISVRDSGGWIHVVWAYSWSLSDSSDIFYSYSTDNGNSWSDMINVSQTGIDRSYAPALAIDSQNNLHCTWNQYEEHSGSFDIYYSKYDGQSWSQSENISNQGCESNFSLLSSIVIDSNNHVFVVWDKYDWPTCDVFYSYYNDTIWSTPYQLSQSTNEDVNPSLAIDKNDNLHAVWSYNGNALLYRQFDGISWTNPDTITMPLPWVWDPCIITNSQCLPRIICTGGSMNYDTFDIFYTEFNGSIWSQPYNVSNSYNSSAQSSFATDSLDNIHIVWCELDNIYYRSYSGGVWSLITNITNDTTSSENPKLGNPVKGDKIDLIWMSRCNTRDIYEVLYLGLNATGVVEQQEKETIYYKPHLIASPNPFTTSTTIHLLGIGHSVEGKELKIYNITGRLVKKLSLPTPYSPLPTGVTWDGRDNEGREVQGGVYFIKVDGECVGKVVKVR